MTKQCLKDEHEKLGYKWDTEIEDRMEDRFSKMSKKKRLPTGTIRLLSESHGNSKPCSTYFNHKEDIITGSKWRGRGYTHVGCAFDKSIVICQYKKQEIR